ncbi:hypothetical protein [Streptomyces sp. NPDC089919]|uniref:hypothetical protein n=1 Tax=Streptomyces sp. NPDC089919 TaxID=3155188 RepID=UPI003442869D
MIRAGCEDRVWTRKDVAAAMGARWSSFRTVRPYQAAGFPPPVSSPGARVLLWDAVQVRAHLDGKPVPDLPPAGGPEDLLDRQEAAEHVGVEPVSWDKYRRGDRLKGTSRTVGGVEHWPRCVLDAYVQGRGVPLLPVGRPKGAGDMVPRDELSARVAELLAASPAVTAREVAERLAVAHTTATAHLKRTRAALVADRLTADPHWAPGDVAAELGVPAAVRRTVLEAARTELAARALRPYVRGVADALTKAGLALDQDVMVTATDDGTLAAAVVLAEDAAVPALTWLEGQGWRPATGRRHPLADNGAPEHTEGVTARLAALADRPEGTEVAAAVRGAAGLF